MIIRAVEKLKNSVAGATSTVDLFERNERNANIMVGSMCFLTSIALLVALCLEFVGVFDVPEAIAWESMFVPAILLIIAHIVCKVRGGSGRWLKLYMLGTLIVTTAFVDLFLNYNATLVMLIAPLASMRYFDKKLTRNVAIITAFLFAVSACLNTIIDSTFFDLNYVGWGEDVTINVRGDNLVQAVLDTGFNRSAYTLYYMTQNFLPKLIVYVIIVLFCILIAGKGRQMVLEEERISTEHARVEQELNTAASIQAHMLPTDFPRNEYYSIFASMTPAKEVGGDFYDFFMVDDTHVAIVIADVSGKGVPASLFMVVAKTLIKEATRPGRDLGEVFTEVNNKLCENNDDGMFVTAFEGVLDLTTGELRFVNAGHEMPFIYRNKEKFEVYKTKAAFVLAGMEGIQYREGEAIQLHPGDAIFQYTDGVTEATDANNQLYGMERLEHALNNNIKTEPEDFLQQIKDDVDKFVGDAPQFDDLTMIGLHFTGVM